MKLSGSLARLDEVQDPRPYSCANNIEKSVICKGICNGISIANADQQWNISIAIYLLADPFAMASFSLAYLQGK